jgi:hypothetical protein
MPVQGQRAARADEEKDRWFNPYRVPRTERAVAVVEHVIDQLVRFESLKGWRARARRPADDASFRQIVTAVICDLMYHELIAAQGQGLVITRSKSILCRRSRYKPPVSTAMFPTIVDRLATPGLWFVCSKPGDRGYFTKARRGCIWPGSRLIVRMEEHGIELEDLGLGGMQETIILKQAKGGHWDVSAYMEYEDTEETRRYRWEMARINDWLQGAELDFDDSVLGEPRIIDTGDRRLRRCFTRGSFTSGGRLFGGFWQTLRKRERFEGLRIEDEAVVSLDYSQMAARLLYGRARRQPPGEDAYILPGMADHREGVKKVFNALLFAEKDLQRLPQGTKALLPKGARVGHLVDRLKQVHAPIADYFGKGIGHELQFTESQILVAVLLQLQDRGIVGLPVHDAVVVKASAAGIAKRIMEETFEAHSGLPGVVTEEH